MKCNGIIALSAGEPRMVQVEVPEPGPHEIQIRIAASLVSAGTERAWVLGLPNALPKYPYVPGYCCSGYVEKTGPGVTGFSCGDRVAAYAVNVGHREIGNVSDYNVVQIPDSVSFRHAAFTSLGQTSLQGVRKCRIELGESIVSLGIGIVGIFALQLAHLNGALPCIAMDRNKTRLDIAEKCHADFTVNNGSDGWQERLLKITDGKGPAVVFDNTGVPGAMTDACRMAADYARICILGCPRGTTDFNFYKDVQKKSLTVIGAHAVDSIPRYHSYPNYWTFADDASCFLRFVEKGAIAVEPLISETVSQKDAGKAYADLIHNDMNALGMIIDWLERS